MNEVYRADLSQFDGEHANAKEAARTAQRLWLKYATAWKHFAETLRPSQPTPNDLLAFLIEQRILAIAYRRCTPVVVCLMPNAITSCCRCASVA